MRSRLLVLLAVAFCASIAGAAGPTSAESVCSRSDVLFCDDWEDGDHAGWDWASWWDSCTTIVGAGGALGTPNALKMTFTDCECGYPGNSPSIQPLNVIKNPIYTRMYVKFSPDYVFLDWTDQKLFYPVRGMNGNATTWRIMLGVSSKSGDKSKGKLVYDAIGHDPRWNYNGTSTQFLTGGQWYCIESMVEGSTPGQSDGRLTLWLDDVVYMDHPNANLKTTTDPVVQAPWLSQYYGGNPCGTHPPQTVWYDQIVTARQRIGCTGGGSGEGSSPLPQVPNVERSDVLE